MEQPSADSGAVGWIYRNRPARFVVSCVCRKTLLRLVGRYADSRLSRIHIRRFAEKRGIADWQGYGSLNAFFARPRANVAFPAREDTLGSPCQALVCAWDQLRPDAVVQVKGVTYPLAELLDEDASRFEGGAAYCLRLESGHHHRVYCFDDGVLEEENSVPGRYASVHAAALPHVPGLYAKNHRVITRYRTEQFGTAMLVEVGAMFIGSVVRQAPLGEPVRRGDVKGWFCFGGSSVLLFFEPGRVRPDADLLAQMAAGIETAVDVGEKIGEKITR